MPESMSIERRKMLLILGARLELTAEKGMVELWRAPRELLDEIPGSVMPQQFENQANPLVHRGLHGKEILERHQVQVWAWWSAALSTDGIRSPASVRCSRRGSRLCAWWRSSRPARRFFPAANPGHHKIQGIGGGDAPAILDAG